MSYQYLEGLSELQVCKICLPTFIVFIVFSVKCLFSRKGYLSQSRVSFSLKSVSFSNFVYFWNSLVHGHVVLLCFVDLHAWVRYQTAFTVCFKGTMMDHILPRMTSSFGFDRWSYPFLVNDRIEPEIVLFCSSDN